MEIIFYIFSFISIISAFIVVFHKQPIYSIFYFIISIISISCIFFSIGSYFAGALEIIIYAGATMILFIFTIMIVNSNKKVKKKKYLIYFNKKNLIYYVIFINLIFLIIEVLSNSLKNKMIIFKSIEAKNIGVSLFGDYYIFVELSSMLLLSSLISVVHIEKNIKLLKNYKSK